MLLCNSICKIGRYTDFESSTSLEVDFQNPGIYGSKQIWDIAWNVFRRGPFRGGRGRRADVDFVVCFGWGGFFCVFFFGLCFFYNEHGLLQV